MLRCGPVPTSINGADHQGYLGLAAEHIAELGALVKDLVKADPHEPHEHHFRDRPQPGHRRTHRRADEPGLADWSIKHPLPAKLFDQSFGHAQDPSPGVVTLQVLDVGTAGHVLTHQDHTGVTPHLLAHRFIQRLAEAQLSFWHIPLLGGWGLGIGVFFLSPDQPPAPSTQHPVPSNSRTRRYRFPAHPGTGSPRRTSLLPRSAQPRGHQSP